ncbi:MAG: hypothetical protein ACOYNZ_07425 [Rhodoferax sp.]
MNSPHQDTPRFVPTLTEIVQADDLVRHSTLAEPLPEDRVRSALQQLDRAIEQRVREELDVLVRTVLAEQLAALQRRLHEEFQSLVRQTVTQASTDAEGHTESK